MNKIIVLLAALFTLLLFPASSHAAPHKCQMALPPQVEQYRGQMAKYFPPEEIDRALACACSESGGNPFAIGFNSNGSTDAGLFQLNSEFHPITKQFNPYNPDLNIHRAAIIWKAHGWRRWYGKACGKPVYWDTKVDSKTTPHSPPQVVAVTLPTQTLTVKQEAALFPPDSSYAYSLVILIALLLLRRYIWGRYLLAVGKAVLRASWRALGWFFVETWRLWLIEARELHRLGRIRRAAKRSARRAYRAALD